MSTECKLPSYWFLLNRGLESLTSSTMIVKVHKPVEGSLALSVATAVTVYVGFISLSGPNDNLISPVSESITNGLSPVPSHSSRYVSSALEPLSLSVALTWREKTNVLFKDKFDNAIMKDKSLCKL